MRVVTKVLTSHKFPLIRPSVRTGAPSPKGEGFGSAQIGRNLVLCGTFGYIYWESGWSAPVGGRAAQCAAPTAKTWQARAARREAAPYKRCGSSPRPCGGVWAKNGGRTVCAPTRESAGTCPLIRLAYGQPSSPQGEGLGKTKRDRSGTCPLKPRGEAELRRKFLCLLSFSKKVRGPGSPPGPLTCVCCKGEGEMGDIDFFWVRSYHNRKIRRNRVRIMNFL